METPGARRIWSTSTLRITLLQLAVVTVFALFGLRLWRLSVVAGEQYRAAAQQNRTRLVRTDAARGVMYDRTHALLVRNVPRFNVLLIPAYLPDDEEATEAVLQRLHVLLELPLESDYAPPAYPPYQGTARLGLREQVAQGGLYAPYQPIVLQRDVTQEVAFAIEEQHLDLPGVLIELSPYREYLTEALTAHILGYMGPIPSGAEDHYGEEQGYEPDDSIGLAGLEASYEDVLRGAKGAKTVEVDVAGREVQTIGQEIAPQAGQSLVLTLDLDLQRYTEQVLRTTMDKVRSGSAVAIVQKVHTGEILAMVSLPTYDNNLFAQGIASKDFARLNTDPWHSLVNHAIGGQYPPGSTFKLVAASAALEEEVVNRWTLITCPSDSGTLWLPNKYYPDDPLLAQPFYCWTHALGYGHGRLSHESAIAYSCDIYFYTIGGGFPDQIEGLGLERMVRYSEAFGYGNPTGIDLPAEASGLVPTQQWKRVNYSEQWTTGDTYNMTIGQGFVLATPLQVVGSAATVANGGTVYAPRLVFEIRDADGNVVRPFTPQVVRELEIADEHLEAVRRGMRAAVERGTAMWLQVGGGLKVAAKTGTAEFYDPRFPADKNGNLPTHAWFTAFAPYEDPEIAVVAFVYNGGEGAVSAMPVVAEILNYYFQLY
ncbi:MAG: penicillin-binding protein 2 [Anaerolineae bacterium]|nr:penicillin-binding protein 2 [Anaerolineae bacterium]